jgi:hypothetical protein
MEITLACLCDMIQAIIKNANKESCFVTMSTHSWELNIWNIFLKNVNASLHLGMVFHHVEDGWTIIFHGWKIGTNPKPILHPIYHHSLFLILWPKGHQYYCVLTQLNIYPIFSISPPTS